MTLPHRPDQDTSCLALLTKDEVFSVMTDLEAASERVEGAERDEVLARIVITEEEIESKRLADGV